MKRKGITQDSRVLDYIKQQGSINPLESWKDLGVYRLAAVIHSLRKQGHRITTQRHGVINKWGKKVHVALYRIKKE